MADATARHIFKGWDPHKKRMVERIYYAGAVENLWGPYAIGFLEWNGENWIDQHSPAFIANEERERGSVYEPNLIYHDGEWKCGMWLAQTSRIILCMDTQKSEDGCSDWSKHAVFAPPKMKMF